MASLLFKDMKGVNFSCASPASAAVCTSIDRRSMVQPAIVGTKRHNHFSKHSSKPHDSYTSKTRKSSLHRTMTSNNTSDLISPANSSRYLLDDKSFFDVCPQSEPVKSLILFENSKKEISASTDHDHEDWDQSLVPINSPRLSSSCITNNKRTLGEKIRDQSLVPFDSRRQVLRPLEGDKSLVPVDSRRNVLRHLDGEKSVLKPSSSTSSHHHQVVVLRVSLHCKGCEGKVRKHISKMEGVTSFNIDLPTKKVTVEGNITPLGVLNSVSKVKSAQFWPSPPRVSASL